MNVITTKYQKNWDIGVIFYAGYFCDDCDEFHEGEIWIGSLSEEGFTTPVTLQINGREVELVFDDCCCGGDYWAEYDFQAGSSYRIAITHAGRTNEANIRAPNELSITSTSPTVFNPRSPFRINWSMQGNTNIQGFEWMADWRVGVWGWEDDYGIINLSSSARNYTFPANTVTIPENSQYWNVDMSVLAANYATSGRVLFLSLASDYRYYWSDDDYNRSRNAKTENHRERMMRAINLIQKSDK
jgi:hypothetical protein